MDRSNNEEHDYESYSEDFDQDDDDQDEEVCIKEESDDDEDEIKVYKSLTGPSITIQPRPRKSKLGTAIKTESDGSLFKNSPRGPLPKYKSTVQKPLSKLGNVSQPSKVPMKPKTGESTTSARKSATTTANTTALKSPYLRSKTTLSSKSRFAPSFSSLNIGKPGTRRVPVTTNFNNRGYTRNKHLAVSPYLPPMKLGTAKATGTVAQRVASAKRMTINDFKNKISQLQAEIEELKRENRTLNHIQNRQNMSLKKWEGSDAELPRLLQQHKEELRNTHEQVKKVSIQCRDHEDKLKLKDKKLLACECELHRLKKLVAKEGLAERQELEHNMDIVSTNLIGAEKRLRQYMRHVDILGKNHLHQIAAEQQKIIRANNHAGELRMEISQLKVALRDKDRMLNYIQMRSTGRNLIRGYQDKERVQYTRYQFPTLESPHSRMGESRSDFSAGERAFLRSRSHEVRRSQGDCLYEHHEHEKTIQTSRSCRDDIVTECSHQSIPKKHCRTGSLDRSSNVSETPQELVSALDKDSPFIQSAEEEMLNRHPQSDTRPSQLIQNSQRSEEKEPYGHTYYHMSQMLGPKNQQDARSSLPPKVPVPGSRTPLQKKTETVRKHLQAEPQQFHESFNHVKIKPQKSQSLHKAKRLRSKSSKTTVVEFRDEQNRKVKQFTSTTHIQRHKHDHSPRNTRNQTEILSDEPHRPHEINSDRHVEFDRPRTSRSRSKASVGRDNGLEVRVQIIKNAGDNFDIQNSSSSSRGSSSGVSISLKGSEFAAVNPPPPIAYADPEKAIVYSHKQNSIKQFDKVHNSPRTPLKYHMDGGDASPRKNSCFESEPEEMVRYHEAAIGDFISSSRSQASSYLVSPRTAKSNLEHPVSQDFSPVVSSSYAESSHPSAMIQSCPNSCSGSDVPTSQVFSTSIPAILSPRKCAVDFNEFGFFNASPNYPVNMDSFSGRDSSSSNPATRLVSSSVQSHLGHQQVSPRGANSYPQMTQNQNSHPVAVKPQTRGIYSTSDKVSPQRQTNQPMNLPFFSTASESRHQDYQRQLISPKTYHRQSGDFHPQMRTNNFETLNSNLAQNQTPNQRRSGKPQDSKSAYDPSVFTKLGTWK